MLAAETGQLVNKNELANTLALNHRTIEKYLFVLQKCFYLNLITPFFQNIRKELTKMPKVYSADLGIRNKLLNRFHSILEREDRGQLLENYAFIRLQELYDKEQIKFWRTADNNEIDFIVTETYGTGKALEIKFTGSKFRRNALKKFTQVYPSYPLHCIAYQPNADSIPVLKL